MSRIRILHVVDTLETGGLENGVVNLIRHMDADRFEHVVCAMRNLGPLADQLPHDRVAVSCLGKTRPGRSVEVFSLANRIRQAQPHVIHARNWGTIEAILSGSFFRSCRLVYSEHGLESASHQTEPRRRAWLRKLAFRLADRVFSVSYQLRDFYAQRTGVSPQRIGVIHNGVDISRFCPRPALRDEVRRQFSIKPHEFSIGTVGRLEPVKDLITLLRAAVGFPASWPWRMVIAGEGSELSALREFVSVNHGLRDRVQLPGEIREVPSFLNALDLYVLPSISEGISNSLLEAMATGLPVVASAVGGNPEVVVDGDSGLLFSAGDVGGLLPRLLALGNDAAYRSRLAQGALRRIQEHFCLDTMVTRYEQLYSSVVLSRGRSQPEQPACDASRASRSGRHL